MFNVFLMNLKFSSYGMGSTHKQVLNETQSDIVRKCRLDFVFHRLNEQIFPSVFSLYFDCAFLYKKSVWATRNQSEVNRCLTSL